MVHCWGPGQATPLHTHAKGVKSWFKVIRGELLLETFPNDSGECAAGNDPDSIKHVLTERLPTIFAEDDDLGVHRLSNKSDLPAVSIHFYSPPLNALIPVQGSKQRITQSYPVVHYSGARSDSMTSSIRHRSERFFGNFESLKQLLDNEFKTKGGLDRGLEAKITHLLQVMSFNPLEWQQYEAWDVDHFTRVLLASTDHYSMILTCWDRGQYSPPHDHGGSTHWLKVLEGSLHEVQYEAHHEEPLRVCRSGLIQSDSVCYNGTSTIHSVINDSEERSYSLNIYSPPYLNANYYDEETGLSKSVKIPQVFGENQMSVRRSHQNDMKESVK